MKRAEHRGSRVGGYTLGYPLAVLAFAGPLLGPGLMANEGSPVVSGGARWTTVRLAELRERDTDRIDLITAGEEQKSSFDQCSLAADASLCRILVSALNVAAIVGTSIK